MKNLKIFALVTVVITATYCTKDTAEEVVPENHANNQQEVSPEILSKLESMGFDTKTKPPKAFEGKIIVEGDITLDEKTILEHQDQKLAYYSLVSCANARNITVLNEMGNTPPGRAVAAAIGLWNNVRNSNLRFVLVNRGPADITMRLDRTINNTALGTLPSNNNAGNLIRVNNSPSVQFPGLNWRNIIAHELGHNIGFLHLSQSHLGTIVPGTEGSFDFNSIMISSPRNISSVRDLSRRDKIAVERMYSNRRDRHCR